MNHIYRITTRHRRSVNFLTVFRWRQLFVLLFWCFFT